ncbi:MAG: trypsin-like peptidase domain-containing protein [Odoribacter sp.]|nr:trypsin-like peptidase domain-containing protein [Odoribacter sp.]
MNIKNIILSLLLGFLGGFLAFFITGKMGDSEMIIPYAQVDVLTPNIIPANYSVPQTLSAGDGRVDLREAARKAVPGVVHVRTIQMGKEFRGNPLLYFFYGEGGEVREQPRTTGYGSGVIISEDGYIITNNHVIRGADQVMITLNDKSEYEAKIIGQDLSTDLALLKIEGENFPYVEYGDSDAISLGEWVLAVGNPYNLTSTVTAGIISAKARDLGMSREQMSLESFLQTDAAVNPGNSGGALVNVNGELVGINTLIQSPTGAFSGYAFAIPVNTVRKVITDLKDYGKVQRAVLGIQMGEVTPAFAEEYKLGETSGIYVGKVIKGGAAEKAGIKEGDIIQSVNNIGVKTASEFYEQLSKYNPGSVVDLGIKRKGSTRVARATLQDNYGDIEVASTNTDDTRILGVKVAPLSREDRARYRIERGGVKIVDIKDGKFKAQGLDTGYIIYKINDYVIYDAESLRKAIESDGDGKVVVTAVNPRGRVEYSAFSLLN